MNVSKSKACVDAVLPVSYFNVLHFLSKMTFSVIRDGKQLEEVVLVVSARLSYGSFFVEIMFWDGCSLSCTS